MVRITNRRIVITHGDPSISGVGDPQTNGCRQTLVRRTHGSARSFLVPQVPRLVWQAYCTFWVLLPPWCFVFIGPWRLTTLYKQSMCHVAEPHGSGNAEIFRSRHWSVSSMRAPGSGRFRPIDKSRCIEGLIRPYDGEPGEEAGRFAGGRLIEARTSGAPRRMDRQAGGRKRCLRLETDLAIGQPAGAHLHTHQ
ncbi:hypothetical protein LMG24238_04580 [Paraburkholderia sediminicola]|uniref:Uncharacterized protein n=1 Tax=Paraburkholderia sediminicola TaxID=458836 RepID=A0A6J5BV92_9BURK|nr:hypothetical protein LMG24238_04580 [Paraburkholderia sediminicola]